MSLMDVSTYEETLFSRFTEIKVSNFHGCALLLVDKGKTKRNVEPQNPKL